MDEGWRPTATWCLVCITLSLTLQGAGCGPLDSCSGVGSFPGLEAGGAAGPASASVLPSALGCFRGRSMRKVIAVEVQYSSNPFRYLHRSTCGVSQPIPTGTTQSFTHGFRLCDVVQVYANRLSPVGGVHKISSRCIRARARQIHR